MKNHALIDNPVVLLIAIPIAFSYVLLHFVFTLIVNKIIHADSQAEHSHFKLASWESD
jgi:hypothetical protein